MTSRCHKSSIKASSEADKKSASQHLDQDNVCYRGDDCQQANEGQQIVGKDNDAKGFNDQSDNSELTTLGNGNGNGGRIPQGKRALSLKCQSGKILFNPVVVALEIYTTATLCVPLANGTLSTLALDMLLGILDALA